MKVLLPPIYHCCQAHAYELRQLNNYHHGACALFFSSTKLEQYGSAVSSLCAAMGLQRDFLSIYRMLAIHTWMIVARVRNEGYEGKDVAQHLYKTFIKDIGIRTDAHPDLKVRYQLQYHAAACAVG